MNKKIAIFTIALLSFLPHFRASFAEPPQQFSPNTSNQDSNSKQSIGTKASTIEDGCPISGSPDKKNRYILTLVNVEPAFKVSYYNKTHDVNLRSPESICKEDKKNPMTNMSLLSILDRTSNAFAAHSSKKEKNSSPMYAVIANCDKLHFPELTTTIAPDASLNKHKEDACTGDYTVSNSKECKYWTERFDKNIQPFSVTFSMDRNHDFKKDIMTTCILPSNHVFSGSKGEVSEKECKDKPNSYWNDSDKTCVTCTKNQQVDNTSCKDKPTPPTPEQQKELDDKCKSLHGPTCTGERDDNKLICKCVESCKDSNDPNVTCKQTFKPRDDEKEKQKALEAKKEKDRAECTRLQMDFDGTRCVPRNQRQNGAGTGRRQGNQQQQPKQQPQQQRGQQGGQGGQQQQQPQQQPQQCPPGTVNAAQYGQYQNPYGGSTLGTSGTLGTLGTLGTQTPMNTGMYGGQQIQCVPIQQQYPPIYPTSTSPFLNMLTQSTTCNSFDIVDVDDTNKIKRNKSFVITWDITTPTGNPSSSIRVNVSPSEKITYKRSDQRATITPAKLGTHTISLALPSSQKENCPSIKFKVVK